MIFIPQIDANDCGFASLSMIAKYYKSAAKIFGGK